MHTVVVKKRSKSCVRTQPSFPSMQVLAKDPQVVNGRELTGAVLAKIDHPFYFVRKVKFGMERVIILNTMQLNINIFWCYVVY